MEKEKSQKLDRLRTFQRLKQASVRIFLQLGIVPRYRTYLSVKVFVNINKKSDCMLTFQHLKQANVRIFLQVGTV